MIEKDHLGSAQVVETSVAYNSPSQDSRGGSRGGEKGDYYPPFSLCLCLSLLAVICSRFFVAEVMFFVCLFLLRMTKGDNKKNIKVCFYQKSYHGRKRHHFNHINEPTNTFGQLVTIKSLVSIQWTMLYCWSSML